ncbi:MAG: glutathione S-transferase family protein [Polyangiaceae bacterium]
MGRLLQGQWQNEAHFANDKGAFVRAETKFRNTVTADGSSGFAAEAGRYHLYVSLACPWAHRTLIARQLKRLDAAISVSIVHPHMAEFGWEFAAFPGSSSDPIHNARYLHEVYTHADSNYTGRVTVPVLWDRKQSTIVCNESRLVLRMLDHEFDALGDARVDLCPSSQQVAIDREIDALYGPVNNGVYRAGFATKQSTYEDAARELFAALDAYEARLTTQRFLLGATLTEADICFFTTLLRFDPVYHYHFKCNLRRIEDYPALSGYLRDIYQTPGVAQTCNLEHIKHHYFTSHPSVNPNRIIPLGPEVDLLRAHGREALGAS